MQTSNPASLGAKETPEQESAIRIETFNGPTDTFVTPSGNKLTIREHDGYDEDLLVREPNHDIAEPFHVYLTSVTTFDQKLQRKPLLEDVLNWPLKDQWYALFRCRKFSLGDKIKFLHSCGNPKCDYEQEYIDDLSAYDQDLSKPLSEQSKAKGMITSYYTANDSVEKTLSSGKSIRFKRLNAFTEKEALKHQGEASINTGFLIRNLEILNSKTRVWERVTTFKIFTAREMTELRGILFEYDSQWIPTSEIKCPKCGNVDVVSLVALPSFFLPTEILN